MPLWLAPHDHVVTRSAAMMAPIFSGDKNCAGEIVPNGAVFQFHADFVPKALEFLAR